MRRATARHHLITARTSVLAAAGLGLLASLTFSACMTRSEGEALRRDVEALKQTLASEQQQADQARQQLKQVIERATALLARSSADVGAQVEQLQQQVAQLTGGLEESAKQIGDLQRLIAEYRAKVDAQLQAAPGAAGSAPAAALPEDKDELFMQGSAKIVGEDVKQGRLLLRRFAERFAQDPRFAQAQLLLGNSYYAEQKFAPAIQEYRKIVEQQRQSPVVPEALYKIGMSFYQLKYCTDADLFLSELLKRHPKSPNVDEARKVLKLIKRYRKNKRVCTS